MAAALRTLGCLAAVLRPLAPSHAYTVEGLKNAHHSIAMKLAIEEDRIEVLQGLLKEFMEVKKVDTTELCSSQSNIYHFADYTPVHYACLLDKDVHLRHLLDAGCPKDLETASGVRPLHAAAEEGSVASVGVLLRAGADPKQLADERILRNNDVPRYGRGNMNAATLAAQRGHVQVLRALKDFGGAALESLHERDMSGLVDERGGTPIQYAVSKGRWDAVRFLTFEVGWGSAVAKAEVVAAAGEKDRAEIEAIARLEGDEFERARERYFMEEARKTSGEL